MRNDGDIDRQRLVHRRRVRRARNACRWRCERLAGGHRGDHVAGQTFGLGLRGGLALVDRRARSGARVGASSQATSSTGADRERNERGYDANSSIRNPPRHILTGELSYRLSHADASLSRKDGRIVHGASCSNRSAMCRSQKRASRKPRKGARKRRIVPAVRDPRRVMQDAQRAQRFDQRELGEVELAKQLVTFHERRPRRLLARGIARRGTSTGPGCADPTCSRPDRRTAGRFRATGCCRHGNRRGCAARGSGPKLSKHCRTRPITCSLTRAYCSSSASGTKPLSITCARARVRRGARASSAGPMRETRARLPMACMRASVRPSKVSVASSSSSGARPAEIRKRREAQAADARTNSRRRARSAPRPAAPRRRARG